MEEILNKNIFDARELAKLSPDFTSNNELLRMQMRSTMVKDTHSHSKIKSDSWLRKTMKRPKDCSKIGKEIAKIRNSFQNINLKNQIMLRNAVKYVDTLKSEHFVNGFNNELDALGYQEENYLKNISEMNLALQNDSEFKLSNKPNKAPKVMRKLKQNKKNHEMDEDNDVKKNTDDAPSFEDILKVECTFAKPSNTNIVDDTEGNEINIDRDDNESNIIQNSNKSQEFDKTPDYDKTLDLIAPQKTIDKDVNDLQSLLIMLAISPQTYENEKVASDEVETEKNGSTEIETKIVSESQERSYTAKSVDICDYFNIIPLRIEINEIRKVLMKKYLEKWKAYVSKKKQKIAQQREETLNSFFEKISKRKSSASETPETPVNKAQILARDYNRYRHRYQMQKHIIALQKAKLEEQNRIIEELKYNRIVEASKISIDTMREEVRKTYYDMDKQLKPKMKCLTSELKVEIEEPSLILHCLKVPQFLQRMEKRAREREEKHAMIRERRKQMEEERTRLKQQEELARAQMDKDEKIKRMNELKDKRKKEKIENIRKKQHTERMRALNVMAELHYEKTLKAKYGIRPFTILLKIKKDNIEKAKAHYKFQLKKNVFLNWMWYTEDMWYERNFKAEDFHRKNILRRAFDCFKQNHHSFVIKRQVADDYYDLYVTNLVFRKLREAIQMVKKENEVKFQMAILYHNSNLKFRTFCCWRTLPALNALKREQEARKARWREKVLQVVPDYAPPED